VREYLAVKVHVSSTLFVGAVWLSMDDFETVLRAWLWACSWIIHKDRQCV